MSSITITLTGNSSSLSANFYPEIVLDERFDYSCSLLDFHTYNSIPNVHECNNKFVYSYNNILTEIEIPIGSYEVEDLIKYINHYFKLEGIEFELRSNKNTFKCHIKCVEGMTILFSRPNSIGSLLGFEVFDLTGSRFYYAKKPVNIQNLNTVRIDCDLTTGSFLNGDSTHTIYEFSPSVSPGYKINEQPSNLIYLPVVRRRINTVNVRIVDQNGKLVDFRGENITCRIHIKKDM